MATPVADGPVAAPASSPDGGAPVRAAPGDGAGAWVSELAEWRVLEEQAEKLNRDLLQYGGSIVAVLGILAGSASVFALADAVSKAGWTLPPGILPALTALSALVLVVLVWLLCTTYRARRRAEHEAYEHLAKLIRLKPDQFLTGAVGR